MRNRIGHGSSRCLSCQNYIQKHLSGNEIQVDWIFLIHIYKLLIKEKEFILLKTVMFLCKKIDLLMYREKKKNKEKKLDIWSKEQILFNFYSIFIQIQCTYTCT